jgi:hypothetical protein
MKHYAMIRVSYQDAIVIPLDKSAALLEIINSPLHRYENTWNSSVEHVDADRGQALVPRTDNLEITVVNEDELKEMKRRGLCEQGRREIRNAERRAEEARAKQEEEQ